MNLPNPYQTFVISDEKNVHYINLDNIFMLHQQISTIEQIDDIYQKTKMIDELYEKLKDMNDDEISPNDRKDLLKKLSKLIKPYDEESKRIDYKIRKALRRLKIKISLEDNITKDPSFINKKMEIARTKQREANRRFRKRKKEKKQLENSNINNAFQDSDTTLYFFPEQDDQEFVLSEASNAVEVDQYFKEFESERAKNELKKLAEIEVKLNKLRSKKVNNDLSIIEKIDEFKKLRRSVPKGSDAASNLKQRITYSIYNLKRKHPHIKNEKQSFFETNETEKETDILPNTAQLFPDQNYVSIEPKYELKETESSDSQSMAVQLNTPDDKRTYVNILHSPKNENSIDTEYNIFGHFTEDDIQKLMLQPELFETLPEDMVV